MAVVFSLDELSAETKELLIKQLTLIPTDPYVEKMRKYGKTLPYTEPKPAVLMFSVNAETNLLRLPFNTAMQLMKDKPNRHKNYPKLLQEGSPKCHAEFRSYQTPVIKECMQQLLDNCTTTLQLPTGWGKTIVGAYLAGRANGVIMVFVHRIQIGEAWVKTFQLCYPQLADYIWFVGEFKNKKGVPAIDQCSVNPVHPCGECKGCLKEEELIPGIIICMDGRYEKVPQRVRDSVAVTIIDEAHLFCTPSRVECLLSTEPKYVIAETATLHRPNGMESMMQAIVGEEGVFRQPDKPHRVYRIKTQIKVRINSGPRGLDFTDLTHNLINCDERNDQAVDCVLCNGHRKIIIMVRFKEHIPLLKDKLEDKGVKVATLFGNQRKYSDSHVLIGTIPKMGVGFDEKNACADFEGRPSDLLILMTSIADLACYIQVVGRVMRSDDPVIFYFEDNLQVVKKHVKATETFILSAKGTVEEMDYNEGEMFIPNMDYSSGEGVIVPLTKDVNKEGKKTIKIKIKGKD